MTFDRDFASARHQVVLLYFLDAKTRTCHYTYLPCQGTMVWKNALGNYVLKIRETTGESLGQAKALGTPINCLEFAERYSKWSVLKHYIGTLGRPLSLIEVCSISTKNILRLILLIVHSHICLVCFLQPMSSYRLLGENSSIKMVGKHTNDICKMV